ncbi:MAG: 16S rRNA (cytosine(1402)-N(4))-methyltransferase RsmH [Chloroflexota bacterium]
MISEFRHTPVLLSESIEALQPAPGGRYVDTTVGGGGHAEKVLELSSPNGTLLGMDADPQALNASAQRLARFGERYTWVEAYFDQLERVARSHGSGNVHGVLFDLGVSSHQIDVAERGFSFAQDGPLDMRFGPSATISASDLINTLPVDRLQRTFQDYGEERFARRIAKRIVEARQRQPITTTRQLVDVIVEVRPRMARESVHPATRVFQALRIAVNDELGRLERALPQARNILAVGGRIVVITFHSLEDRIVKRFMRDEARGCICPPQVPICVCGRTPTLRLLWTRPLTASPDDVAGNPRSRSAKLRAAERLCAEKVITTDSPSGRAE